MSPSRLLRELDAARADERDPGRRHADTTCREGKLVEGRCIARVSHKRQAHNRDLRLRLTSGRPLGKDCGVIHRRGYCGRGRHRLPRIPGSIRRRLIMLPHPPGSPYGRRSATAGFPTFPTCATTCSRSRRRTCRRAEPAVADAARVRPGTAGELHRERDRRGARVRRASSRGGRCRTPFAPVHLLQRARHGGHVNDRRGGRDPRRHQVASPRGRRPRACGPTTSRSSRTRRRSAYEARAPEASCATRASRRPRRPAERARLRVRDRVRVHGLHVSFEAEWRRPACPCRGRARRCSAATRSSRSATSRSTATSTSSAATRGALTGATTATLDAGGVPHERLARERLLGDRAGRVRTGAARRSALTRVNRPS